MSGRDDTASLDDLLRHEDEPVRVRTADSVGGWLAKHTGYSVLLAVLAWGFGRSVEKDVPFLLLVLGFLALFGLRRVVAEVAPPAPEELQARSSAADYEESQLLWPTADGLYLAVARWDNRLTWTQRDAERFDSSVRPYLGELADERLRQRYGCTRASDPARARQLLGDPLWTFLNTPVTRSPTPRLLTGIVKQLEAL